MRYVVYLWYRVWMRIWLNRHALRAFGTLALIACSVIAAIVVLVTLRVP